MKDNLQDNQRREDAWISQVPRAGVSMTMPCAVNLRTSEGLIICCFVLLPILARDIDDVCVCSDSVIHLFKRSPWI